MRPYTIFSLFIILLLLNSCKQNDEIFTPIQGEINGPFIDVWDNLTFTSNEQIANYFGADSIKGAFIDIHGDLTIKGNVTNLYGLKYLYSVSGNLTIEPNSFKNSLGSFQGLESLTSVGGDLKLSSFYAIDLKGLTRLKNVGKYLTINYGLSLISLTGMESLEKVGYGLRLISLPKLDNLEGLPYMSSLFSLYLENLPLLKNLKGLEIFPEINSLEFKDNENLEDLSVISNVDWSNISVINNSKLASLNGIGNQTIANNINIVDNIALKDLQGLASIEIVDELSIYGNGFTKIEGLESITSIGMLTLAEENLVDFVLPEITSLQSLRIMNSHVSISFPKIETDKFHFFSISGASPKFLFPISEIEVFALEFTNVNDEFEFSGIQHVGYLSTYGSTFNTSKVIFPDLESLDDLLVLETNTENLTWVPYLKSAIAVKILNSPSIKNLSGLENLQTVSDKVEIKGNSNLEDFCALKNLFTNNPNLDSEILGNKSNPTKQDIINCP